VAERLALEYRIIALDNRGCGRSGTPREDYAIAEMAEDAVRLLDELGIAQASVVGHSMGGYIAQEMAIHHPRRVSKLILAGSSLVSSVRNNNLFEDFGNRLDTEVYPDWLRSWTPWLFSPECCAQPNFIDDFVAAGAAYPYRQTLDGFLGQVRALRGFDARGRAAGIRSRALVIAGEKDILITPMEAEALAREIPGCDLRLLNGVGHSLHVEAPVAFAECALAFLKN
jgi:pimeloyl-ACP methyl ester carboxylesterase